MRFKDVKSTFCYSRSGSAVGSVAASWFDVREFECHSGLDEVTLAPLGVSCVSSGGNL